jgi:hypothetical protein
MSLVRHGHSTFVTLLLPLLLLYIVENACCLKLWSCETVSAHRTAGHDADAAGIGHVAVSCNSVTQAKYAQTTVYC